MCIWLVDDNVNADLLKAKEVNTVMIQEWPGHLVTLLL